VKLVAANHEGRDEAAERNDGDEVKQIHGRVSHRERLHREIYENPRKRSVNTSRGFVKTMDVVRETAGLTQQYGLAGRLSGFRTAV
jgi:hypothetical protein